MKYMGESFTTNCKGCKYVQNPSELWVPRGPDGCAYNIMFDHKIMTASEKTEGCTTISHFMLKYLLLISQTLRLLYTKVNIPFSHKFKQQVFGLGGRGLSWWVYTNSKKVAGMLQSLAPIVALKLNLNFLSQQPPYTLILLINEDQQVQEGMIMCGKTIQKFVYNQLIQSYFILKT